MSMGRGNRSSAASYDKYNFGVNTRISVTDASDMLLNDNSQLRVTKENQRIEQSTL
jgi:hypothetical protein